MAGPLKNARWEEFAQRMARGERQGAAYVAVGYAKSSNTDKAAHLLANNPLVSARIAKLLERGAQRAEFDIAAALKR